VVLLKQFGPAYYVVFAIELFIWIGIGSVVVMKFVRKLSAASPQPMSSA